MTDEKPLDLELSPAQEAVDQTRALCSPSGRFKGAWLWDAELDGGGEKNAKGESSVARAYRHEAAKSICRICPERQVCLNAARRDPAAEGIYGAELITNLSNPKGFSHDRLRRDTRETELPSSGTDL